MSSPARQLELDWAPAPDPAARDAAIASMNGKHPEAVAALQAEAWRLWREHLHPLSANDVRPVLARFPDVDPRILVSAFPRSQWEVCGTTKATAPGNHARRISLFRPKGSGLSLASIP